jgi:hypothetical protein
MIPVVVGGIFVVAVGMNYLVAGAAAGTGYGLGRKYGRKVCEAMDNLTTSIPHLNNKE